MTATPGSRNSICTSEAGKVTPFVDRTYPLEDIVDAYRYVETQQKVGNVVIGQSDEGGALPTLYAAVEEHRLTVTHLLLTHHHHDHVGVPRRLRRKQQGVSRPSQVTADEQTDPGDFELRIGRPQDVARVPEANPETRRDVVPRAVAAWDHMLTTAGISAGDCAAVALALPFLIERPEIGLPQAGCP